MPISDDDLNYLRNINTRPGPNAGRSIDPTKPGPDADRASPEPQDVREALADLIFAAEQYLDFDGDRRAIPDLIRRAKEKGKAALARSDASGMEWPYGYQDTFNLISDATGLLNGHIGISVSKFEKAYNKLRARAADRSVQWQTIETAPKDGTRILLANEVLFAAGQICRRIEPDWRYRGLENGKITERFTERIPNPDAGTVHEWWQKDYPSAFREEDATGPDYDGNSPAWEPTHWMPLPEPPIKVIPKKRAIPPLRYSDTAEHMPDGTEIRRLEIRK